MKFDVLKNQTQSKDTKISKLENSIAAIKEMCAAKIKVCIMVCALLECFDITGFSIVSIETFLENIFVVFTFPLQVGNSVIINAVLIL